MKRSVYCIQLLLIATIATGLFISSCTRPVEVNGPELKAQIIVNCLFNPDSSWEVYVGKMKAVSATGSFQPVGDAAVRVLGGGQTIPLHYGFDGHYVAAGEKPQAGIPYRLEVAVPGFPLITAGSSIPQKASLSHIHFDTAFSYFIPDNGFDNVKVNRINLTLDLPKQPEQYYELLGYKYNIDAYCDYIITDRVLKELRQYNAPDGMAQGTIPSDYIDRLEYFLDVPITGRKHFLDMLTRRTGTSYWGPLVCEYAEKVRHAPKTYDSSKFMPKELYSKGLHFYNITGDSHGVFGSYLEVPSSHKDSLTVFMENLSSTGVWHNGYDITQQNEGWLDIYALSKDMYQYQTTYINQLVNEENPFAQPVEVYSNMHNGTGIFAGYRKQRVKVY